MRKVVLALAAALLLCAQSALPGFPPGVFSGRGALDAPGGATYRGPGDLGFGAVAAFYSFRCYSSSYSGNVADIWDGATGSTTETTITCDGHGNLVVTSPTAIATTCAVSCKVKTLYDQTTGNQCASASCDITQATNSARPPFLYQSATCGANSRSCMQCVSANSVLMASANSLTLSQTIYVSSVFDFTVNTNEAAFWNLTAGSVSVWHGSANQVLLYAGTVATNQTVNDNTWHTHQATFNSSSSAAYIDGSSTTGLNPGTAGSAGKIRLCTNGTTTIYADGYVAEVGIWPSTSTFSASSLYTNQHNWYGF